MLPLVAVREPSICKLPFTFVIELTVFPPEIVEWPIDVRLSNVVILDWDEPITVVASAASDAVPVKFPCIVPAILKLPPMLKWLDIFVLPLIFNLYTLPGSSVPIPTFPFELIIMCLVPDV